MTLFEETFWRQLNEFIDFQQKKNPKAKKPWHQQVFKGGDAKGQQQVANRYKGRYTGDGEFTYSGELNSKIESIRNGSNVERVCSDADIDHILKNYPIDELSKDKPKRLSNTGIVVQWDPLKAVYMLRMDTGTHSDEE